MPVYEYQCTECGQIEEALQKISEPPKETCIHCKGTLKKLISQSTFHLKGSGWYVTDYGGAKKGPEEKSGAKPGAKPGIKSDKTQGAKTGVKASSASDTKSRKVKTTSKKTNN